MEPEKEELIQSLEKRLTWYLHEASEKEFDRGEVEMLVLMLRKLGKGEELNDIYFNPDDSLERFRERYSEDIRKHKKKIVRKIIWISVILIFAILVIVLNGIELYKWRELKSGNADGEHVLIQFEENPGNEYTLWDELSQLKGSTIFVPVLKKMRLDSVAYSSLGRDIGQVLNICYTVYGEELWCTVRKLPNGEIPVPEYYSYTSPLDVVLKTKSNHPVVLRQTSDGTLFGMLRDEDCFYIFSGEFTVEEFEKIISSVEKMQLF